MTESETDSEHQMDIVLRGMITQIKKAYKKEFSKVFHELLTNISIDFDISLDELTNRYNPTYQFHLKKPRDPATACLDTTKSGDPCTKTRKEGFNYCGIHLRTRKIDPNDPNAINYSNHNSVTDDDQEERYVPKSPKRSKPISKTKSKPKPNIKPKTKPKLELELEPSEPDLTEDEETTNSTNNSDYEDEDGGGTEHSFDIWDHDEKKYVILDEKKIFLHPGVDEINSIADLGDIVAFKLKDGTVEWV